MRKESPPVTLTGGRIWFGGECRSGTLTIAGGIIKSLQFGSSRRRDAGDAIDLQGSAVLPGFADGHAHPIFGGTEPAQAPIRAARTIDEVQQAVGRWASENASAEWVQGGGYNPAMTPDGCFAAAWLDEVVPDRPVVLRAEDYHTVWCNSEALRRAGIDETTPDPPNGRIVRDSSGRPLGTLREWGAVDLVLSLVGRPPWDERQAALALGLKTLAEAGVTFVQDAWVEPEDVELYVAAAAADELPIRVNLALRVEPGGWRAQREGFLHARERVRSLDHPHLTCQTVKFFLDGCVELGTAAVLAPYLNAGQDTGMTMWSPADLTKAATVFDRDGFQLHVHAIGDAAVRSALDTIETVQVANGPRDRRPVLAHAQLVAPADIPRFGKLGVIANFQPGWPQASAVQTVLTVPRLGRERADLQYPIQSILKSGGGVSFGSDWPCGPYRPLGGLRTVITRTTPQGTTPWTPEERLTVQQAVDAHTAAVAYQMYAESEWGSLEVGRAADLVILSDDPASVEPERLADLDVLSTWVAGRPVSEGALTRS
jgi:predicted amidohydrolase YtcJ